MAALEIRWESVQRISPKDAVVVTGSDEPKAAAKDAEPAKPTLPKASKPIAIYVSDLVDSDDQKKLETVTFKAEKVALGFKAFRTVRMDSTQAAADPLLADKGKESPRILLVNPQDGKVTVLEKSKLSASAVYTALEDVAGKFYVEKLDKTVKSHLDLLCEQDQLANKEKKLNGDSERASDKDGAKAKKDQEEIKKELEAVRKEMSDVSKKQAELWKLTPKAKAEAAA
jgi:hypothetical protein